MTDLALHQDALSWTDADRRTVSRVRALVADVVESVGGHPGTALSLAPVAHLLFQKVMRHDPSDPRWLGRDRFVLSAGHSALTQYVQLHLTGYPIAMEDIRTMRTLPSKVHGHPEYELDDGIEMTTGPLGEGFGAAVGMAMAARRERGLLDPHTEDGTSVFDHTIWVIASDGDLQEGIAAEAASLAGHQQLGNLVVVWDDNNISAEDELQLSWSEDVLAKFAAMGWHTQRVDWTKTGSYVEDMHELHTALLAARSESGRPSLIGLRTIMGWPTPTKQGTADIHGTPLGTEEVRGLKTELGMDPDQHFVFEQELLDNSLLVRARGQVLHSDWTRAFDSWSEANPDSRGLLDRLQSGQLPEGWEAALPTFAAGIPVATRVASGQTLTALKDTLPELWGGSADMNESTSSYMAGEPSFVPEDSVSRNFGAGHRYGRTLHFGVREHAMAAAVNGMVLHGLTRPYGSTFLQFAFHMLPSVRLGALMGLPTIFIWTHDSIGLGQDGPTHQPVEHLAALRAMPGVDVIRPADANEVVHAWRRVLTDRRGPSGFVLSRQKLPVLARVGDETDAECAPAAFTTRGAYVLQEPPAGLGLDVILIGTGSEVQLAVQAREQLSTEGIGARVVSMPCREWFTDQPQEYRDEVLPPACRARVSVEAATSLGWRDFVGDAGVSVALDHFGASAPAEVLFETFGITAAAVAAGARESISRAAEPSTVRTAQR
ncbi:Transketolase [metagenome]|uniref:transketolase n=1 Tax=metagenome TaxID=256318 RepID=A0A2P2C0G5_9ZZZZ